MKTDFHFLMLKTFHAQRNHIRNHMNDIYGLSPGQPKVLRFIAGHEDCKLKDIAMEYDIEPATVSRILNSMESSGLLTRQIDPHNKRALKLRITDLGGKALAAWLVHCREVEKISLSGFSREEVEHFSSYLARMYENLSGRKIE